MATFCFKGSANTGHAEVDRAADNLAKSGKGFGFPQMSGRRESMPVTVPRPYPEYGTELDLNNIEVGI